MTGTVVAPSGTQPELFGSGVKIDYVEATNSYTFTASTGETVTLDESNKNQFLPSPTLQWAKTTGTVEDQVLLLVPGTTGPIRYVASGSWTTTDSGPGDDKVRLFVAGAQTQAGDVPLSGTGDYFFRTAGGVTDNGTAYNLYIPETTVTFSANFAAGTVATSLHLISRPGSSSVDLGTYSGTGTIASGGPGFSGTLAGTGTSAGRTGGFSGAFFGPQAIEIGYAWYLSGTNFAANGFGVGLSKTAGAQAYKTVDELTGDQRFVTAGVTFKGSPAAPTDKQIKTYGQGFSIAYAADTDTYTVEVTGSEAASVTFGDSNLAPLPGQPANVVRWLKTDSTSNDVFTLVRPMVNGVALNYTMIGSWVRQYPSLPANDKYQLSVGGIPTGLDMPTSGTGTYTFQTGGTVQDGGTTYSITDTASNGTLAANFGNGAITTTLTLAGRPTGASTDTALGTFSGTGTLTSGFPYFSGTLTGTGDRTGGFAGSFFGPGAAEVGYGWEVHGTNFQAQGVGAGKKD